MVLVQPVGKKRSFGRGLFLVVITLGIYAIYWWYKAPNELHRQFELDREGRDDAVVWLVLGLVIPVLVLVYFWKAIGNLRYLRERLGISPGVTPGKFLALYAVGYLAVAVGTIALFVETDGIDPDGDGVLTDEESDALSRGLATLGLMGLVALASVGYAFYCLQSSINGAWDAWRDRVHELTVAGPPPGAPPAWNVEDPSVGPPPPPPPLLPP